MKLDRILKLSIIILLLSAVLWALLTNDRTPTAVSDSQWLMGTLVEMRVFGSQSAMRGAFKRIEEVDHAMSRTHPDSYIYAINASAGESWVKVDQDTFHVIQASIEYAALTQGLFEPSIGPLVELWAIGTPRASLPSAEAVEERKQLINYHDIQLDVEKRQVKLGAAGMGIDLGAIAKGYGADAAAAFLRNQGVKSAFLNLGGNVYVLGAKPDGTPWRIGIQNPEAPRGTHMAVLEVEDTSIVTSGPYERYFIEDGIRYHHILDPVSGYPAESGLASVTIVSPSSTAADALATGVFILGMEKGLELLENLDNVEGILVGDNRQVYVTSGLKGRLLSLAEGFELYE